MSGLKDKVVLITGASSDIGSGTAIELAFAGCQLVICASSGIGSGTAIQLAGAGCQLAIHGRNKENLEKVAQQCQEKGLPAEKVFQVFGDLSDDAQVKSILEQVIQKFQRLDVLVNNAGITHSNTCEGVDMELHDRIMNINVRSIVYLTHLAIPHLIKTKGNIINVSSVTGLRSFPNIMSYCMSKAAIDQFTKCTALDLAPKQVRVNAVNPAVIVTEVHKRSGMNDKAYEQFLEHSKTTHALGRVGTIDEVGKAILFLASDDSSFITGCNLPVDGGMQAMCSN